MTIRVLVAEDHVLMVEAIVGQLKKQGEIQVVATAADGLTLLNLVREHQPDVVLLDLSMPDFDPLPGFKAIQRECPNARCIVLTGDDNPFFMHTMVDAGVWGYILKSESLSLALSQAVIRVHEVKRFFSPEASDILLAQSNSIMPLTQREIQILGLVAYGCQNNHIAEMLGLSSHRVRHALSDAYMKLGVQETDPQINPRVAAIKKAQQIGLLSSN